MSNCRPSDVVFPSALPWIIQLFNYIQEWLGSNPQIHWRSDLLSDFRRLQITPSAERLVRWDSRHPRDIFLHGFLPRATSNEPDINGPPLTEFNLATYVSENHDSYFVSTTRTRRDENGRIVRWEPEWLLRETRFEYEIFAFGGIEVNRSVQNQTYSYENEIAFVGGIRPEFIRSAVEYNSENVAVSIWMNERFDIRANPDPVEAEAAVPFPGEVRALRIVYWTPPTGHDEFKRSITDYEELMRGPGKIAVDPILDPLATSTGSFNTQQVRPWDKPTQETSKRLPLCMKHYSKAPGLVMGLTSIDASQDNTILVKCFGDNVTTTEMTVHLNTWLTSTLYSGACMWMEISASDPNFQFGQFSTTEDHPWDSPQPKTSRQIKFRQPFSVIPNVEVWLSEIDMYKSKNWRVKTYVSDITHTGFTIHIDTWEDTTLYVATAEWVAYPGGTNRIQSGRFSTHDVRPPNDPQTNTSGSVSFKRTFDQPPILFAALNSIDIGCGQNLRVKLNTSLGTTRGFEWSLNAWSNTVLYAAGASWVAFQ